MSPTPRPTPADCTCQDTDPATVIRHALECKPTGCPWHEARATTEGTEPPALNSTALEQALLDALNTDRK